jgi:hypothetical protein
MSEPQNAEPVAASPVQNIASTVSNVASQATSQVSNVLGNAKDYIFNNPRVVTIGLIVVAAGAFMIAYLLYWAINNALLAKRGTVINETKVPRMGTDLTKIPGVASPVPKNGKRMSFTFWIYIHDIDKYRGSKRHVLHIGDQATITGSPIVYMGSDDTKMYIAFNPIQQPVMYPASAVSVSDKLDYLSSTYGIVIDYVPIQRWVHVAVVVNENSNGGTISAYLDADLVKKINTGTTTRVKTFTNPAMIQNLQLDKAGALYIGGSLSDDVGPGFSGLVSKVTLYSFDLNVRDIYFDYRQGPIDNLLSRMGLPAYGVRSPIYKVG